MQGGCEYLNLSIDTITVAMETFGALHDKNRVKKRFDIFTSFEPSNKKMIINFLFFLKSDEVRHVCPRKKKKK